MTDNVQLARPGAGLPALELMISRVGFGLLRTALCRRYVLDWLISESQKVMAIARELSEDRLKCQVLVPRPVGLEDSSRNWSAAMVLQHLVIVDTGIVDLIDALTRDQAFGREVRIADVKPCPSAGREQLELLEDVSRNYTVRLAAIKSLRTARRHAHPWFGPLDGHGWHTLAALHTMIHRRQLQAIVRVLGTDQ